MSWTTTDLLTNIKNREMFPDASTGSLSDTALLQYATDELYITLLPMIMGVRENYYATYTDYSYTNSTPTIRIPGRAIGGGLSSVQYIYGQAICNLDPIQPTIAWTTVTSSSPSNFFFQNNDVVFFPPPAGAYGTIRFRWFQRPSRLALTSDCAQITAFNSTTGQATCTVPTSWTTSNIFDFIPQEASEATPFALDSVANSITSTSMTFSALSSTDLATIAVGDWIALSQYTPIPEIPFEFQVVLAQATCVRGLEATNDEIGLKAAMPTLQAYMQGAVKMLTPRDQLGNKKVVSSWRLF